MQNRLLALLLLLISGQAYCEDSVTDNPETKSQVTASKDDIQTQAELPEQSQLESTDTSESANDSTDEEDASLNFDVEPSSPPAAQETELKTTTPAETSPDEDDASLNFDVESSSPQPSAESDVAAKEEAVSPTESSEDNIATKTAAKEDNSADKNESATDEDGVDEELIAELLEEDPDVEDQSDDAEEPVEAKAEKAPSIANLSTWLPEIEFGYRSEQGNDDERSLNARLSLSYISGRLRNTGEIKIYMKNEDGEADEREQSYQLQSDYKISPKMYIYGNFKGIDSKYNSYFHDYTVSTGLGYQITNTDTLKVETELGPGYRYQEPNTDEIDDDDPIFPENVDEPIIRANLTANWKPFDMTSFNFEGTVVSGSSNTRIDTEISIINNITEDVALKIAQSRQHLSRVPNNLSKTDSTVTINILYSPK